MTEGLTALSDRKLTSRSLKDQRRTEKFHHMISFPILSFDGFGLSQSEVVLKRGKTTLRGYTQSGVKILLD